MQYNQNNKRRKIKMKSLSSMFRGLVTRSRAVKTSLTVLVVSAFVVAPALATESEGSKKVKEVTTSVSTEGVEIILAVLGGLVALIALSIILPKAIGFIRRFI
jgi:hypothetical protein